MRWLEEILARARKRHQPPTAARVGDQIEFVNPDEEQAGLEHPERTFAL